MKSSANVTSRLRSYVLHEICGNRDMSKEEGARIILSEPGKHCSHQFI